MRKHATSWRHSEDEGVGNGSNLGQSLDMYSVSLNALRDGMLNAGVNPPPNDIIKAELASVSDTWQQSKPVLDAIRGGMVPTAENVEALANVSSALMTDMDNVVTLYMLATPGQENVYRVPFMAWGHGVANGADLYELNRYTRNHPGNREGQRLPRTFEGRREGVSSIIAGDRLRVLGEDQPGPDARGDCPGVVRLEARELRRR